MVHLSSKSQGLGKWPEAFLKAGLYLRNWSAKTMRTYRQGLSSLYQTLPADQAIPTKDQLAAWVIQMREKGLQPGGCNMYIRTVNSFLSWLREEGEGVPSPLKLLRAPKHQLTLLSAADVKALLLFKAKSVVERRTRTLVLLLLDTGIRIDEALGIERAKVDLDAMTLVVFGKGAKERVVPFSHEMRKVLFRHLMQIEAARFVFCSRSGSRLMYRNVYREIAGLCAKAGLAVKVHPHLFRHVFAANFIKHGGDIYRLSRLLGHTNVATTQIYLRSLQVTELRSGVENLSPLVAA
jgi:integrase/recombinase XerD